MTNESMFEQNKKLAYKIANKYRINYTLEYEDIKQVALLGLWKAVLTFKNTYEFSTYAYRVIVNEITDYLREIRKNTAISLNNELESKNELIDGVNEIEDLEKKIDIQNYIEKIKKSDLNSKTRLIIELKLKGYTQKKIAKILGYSETQICRIIKSLKQILE